MRILHVITHLGMGGAEVMLHRLLEASNPDEMSHEVVSLTELGVIADRIRDLGIRTRALGMRRQGMRFPDPVRVLRLAELIRESRPDVVQTWLYHADLLGGVAAKLAGRARIFWGIHNNALDGPGIRRTTRWTAAACARLSRFIPDGIVTVSLAARDLHVAAGYDARKFVFIPNGFDVTAFRPDPAWRREAREELGLAPEDVVVGLPARLDPQKDHMNFVRAAALLAGRRRDVRFVLCGDGVSPASAELADAIRSHRLDGRVLLLGRRSDMPRLLNAMDVCTLSSASEAFPLAIGEAMACGIPCVVTDVGDCRYLVGDTGRVVPRRDSEALARGWEALIALGPDGRRRLGALARERIQAQFTLPRIAGQYAELYRRAIGAGTAVAPPVAAAPEHAASRRAAGAALHGPAYAPTPPPTRIRPEPSVIGTNAK